MTKSIVIVGLCAVAAGAFGLGSLLGSYASPGQYPNGIGYISTSYMEVSTNTPDYVYRLVRTTGSVASSFDTPTGNTAGSDYGSISGTGYIFVVNGDYVYRMGWNSGSIYSSWGTPNSDIRGVAFRIYQDTNYIVLTEWNDATRRMFRCNTTTGSIYASYTLGFRPYDIAHDVERDCLWVSDVTNNRVQRINYTGGSTASFTVPYTPYGLGYDRVGDTVWVGRNGPHYIYVYETGSTNVAPASVGKIKALYR